MYIRAPAKIHNSYELCRFPMDKIRRLHLPSDDGPDLHSTKVSRTLCERSSVSDKWTLSSVYDDE